MTEPAKRAGTGTENAERQYGVLQKRSEFLAARRGAKVRGVFVFVEAGGRGDTSSPRLGLTVSRKNGNAVARNQIKRRLREAVRLHAAGDMTAGNDYVVVSTPRVLTAPFPALCEDLSAAFLQANKKLERWRNRTAEDQENHDG